MGGDQAEVKIPMQVGSELRIKNTGEISISNPEIELADLDIAADAVLSYRFDEATGEHVLRLMEPYVEKHPRSHHRRP